MNELITDVSIQGIEIEESSGCYLFRITELSEELLAVIKKQFSSIFSGAVNADSGSSLYSLEQTVKNFLERYSTKPEKIKKGMIGELLSHVLINNFIDKLESISVLMNKEEGAIKKGFDIIYYDLDDKSIWYSEVKSGEETANERDHNKLAKNHLAIAKSSISNMLQDENKRWNRWNSALIDVKLTIQDSNHATDLSDILELGYDDPNTETKSVILISVLYHNMEDSVSIDTLHDYLEGLIEEAVFSSQILISIHKQTYQAVATFLEELARSEDD